MVTATEVSMLTRAALKFCNYQCCKDEVKGTNGRQKTCEIFHVYCIFYSGFMCQTTVIFGITKDGSLILNSLHHEIVPLAETSFKMALTICQNG